MEKVRVVKFNGQCSTYNVEYPTAYIAKIMEIEERIGGGEWIDGRKEISVKEIYANEKLIAEFNGSTLSLAKVKHKPKKIADAVDEALELGRDLKDKIKAEDDWNEYQAEILHAQKMIKENIWVMDHTGGNVKITYS